MGKDQLGKILGDKVLSKMFFELVTTCAGVVRALENFLKKYLVKRKRWMMVIIIIIYFKGHVSRASEAESAAHAVPHEERTFDLQRRRRRK